MSEDKYEKTKETVLAHIQQLFEELEEDMAMSHQEKYAMLEDAFESASDEDELRVAFERWYADHAEDLKLEYNTDELWDQAMSGGIEYDEYIAEKDEIDSLDTENIADEEEEVL